MTSFSPARPGKDVSFRGIYPMQFAFYDVEGKLDRTAMRRQLEGCIAAGVDGIAILGLGTEVNKLSLAERRSLLDWTAEDLKGRLPLAVTIAEASAPEQIAFGRAAKAAGAGWVVLQPPPVRGVSEAEYVRFFGTVADGIDLPLGIQNAPEYTGIGVSNAAIVALARQHGNFKVLKGEGPALAIRQVIEDTQGELAVFNGRGGLELTDNLRAGCAGMIPGAESCDIQKRIFDLIRSSAPDDHGKAEALYRDLLPLVVFMMQSLENFLCYGKRLAALRYGIGEVRSRVPASLPNEFGLTALKNAARHLWPEIAVRSIA